MEFIKTTFIFLTILLNLNLSAVSFGNTKLLLTEESLINPKKIKTLKETPEIKEFFMLKEIYEQELTHFEVVGREKSEKEENRSKKVKKILFHLDNILKVLRKDKQSFP